MFLFELIWTSWVDIPEEGFQLFSHTQYKVTGEVYQNNITVKVAII